MSEKTSGLAGLTQTVSTFWLARNAQERRLLIGASSALLALLVYLILIGPALNGGIRLKKELPKLREEAAEMRDLYKQATELASKTAAAPAPMTKESLESGLVRKGIKTQSIVITGEFAKIQLSDVPFAAVISWLDEIRRTSRISATETSFGSQSQATGSVNATMTLHQQKGDQN